jgi:hypothetical protein
MGCVAFFRNHGLLLTTDCILLTLSRNPGHAGVESTGEVKPAIQSTLEVKAGKKKKIRCDAAIGTELTSDHYHCDRLLR